ncbi:MAG: enoyl-CoA hydratase/isomerase family protein, partial [Halobacteriota archaeon]|nr:enoyl-CoA hydratase/isomerase family protein [Halobacteriota archaeon]
MAKITFNRPKKLNALNGTMWKEIRSAIRDANEDKDVVAIVITGSGRAFSAGNDISDFEGSIGDGSAEKLIQAIVNSKKPVISAVNGLAFGGGFELVLACDIS